METTIFQGCHHRFQRIEADIQLPTQFPSRNPSIHAGELIETFFISRCDNCAWPSGRWLVFHFTVATAETHHPPPHCANIHCFVSVNVQQASMNVIGYSFFSPHGGIQLHTSASNVLQCQTPFCLTAPLLSSVARQQNLTEYWREGSPSTAIPSTSASDVVDQHNKIGGITFGDALVLQYQLNVPTYDNPQGIIINE